MIVQHVAPAGWADTDEEDKIQPSEIVALGHEATLDAAEIEAIAAQVAALNESAPVQSGGALEWGHVANAVNNDIWNAQAGKRYVNTGEAALSKLWFVLPDNPADGAAVTFSTAGAIADFRAVGMPLDGNGDWTKPKAAPVSMPANSAVTFAFRVASGGWLRVA